MEVGKNSRMLDYSAEIKKIDDSSETIAKNPAKNRSRYFQIEHFFIIQRI
jgi:hypothetical protein